MCTLIGGTIGFSIIYALFFFMPAMALLGPWGVSRSVPGHVRHALGMDADGGATATSSA